MSDKKYYVNFY